MNMDYGQVFALRIVELTDDAFVYENEYGHNFDQIYVEKAFLKRLSFTPDKSKSTSFTNQKPNKGGSLFKR